MYHRLSMLIYSAPGGSLLLDATPYVLKCNFSQGERGCERLTADLSLALWQLYWLYDMAGVAHVVVSDGISDIWAGRLEDPGISLNDSGVGLRITALGYWRALSDIQYTSVWSTTDFRAFRPVTRDEVATAQPEAFTIDTNGRINIAPQLNASYGNSPWTVAEVAAIYPDKGRGSWGYVQFEVELYMPAGWTFRFGTWSGSAPGAGAFTEITTLASTGGVQRVAYVWAFSAAPVFIFGLYRNSANAAHPNQNGVNYARVNYFRLCNGYNRAVATTTTTAAVGNGTNVTITPASMTNISAGQRLRLAGGGASEMITVASVGTTTITATRVRNAPGGGYPIGSTMDGVVVDADLIASDIVSAVTATNSAQLDSGTALIQALGRDLSDESYEDASMADLLTSLAQRGSSTGGLYEVGVDAARRLYFRPQGSFAQTWHVEADDISITRSADQLYNSAYGLYTDASGRKQRTAAVADANSKTRYAITRQAVVNTKTTNDTQAQAAAQARVTDGADPTPRGTFRLTAVYAQNGARMPAYVIRPGDTVVVIGIPAGSAAISRARQFVVAHTAYDAMDGSIDVEPKYPAATQLLRALPAGTSSTISL